MVIFLEAIVRLYDYQREMNNHVLDVAERLSGDELTSVIVEGQRTIRDTLLHMIDTVQTNVSWWDGSMTGEAAFAREFLAQDYPDLASLRNFWRTADSDVAAFVGSLVSDADLGRVYERSTPNGGKRQRALWEMMLHVVNHGTQHRSEVAMMLTKLGHSPGDMEIL